MSSWLIHLITVYGLLIIFVLMVAENACLPIPSEVVIPYGGVLVALGHTSMWAVIVVSTAAAVLGAGTVYAVGRFGGRPLALRYGHRIHIKPSHVDKAEEWFARRGQPMVLYTRMLPVVRTFISLPAGIARMPWMRFLLLTAIGSYHAFNFTESVELVPTSGAICPVHAQRRRARRSNHRGAGCVVPVEVA